MPEDCSSKCPAKSKNAFEGPSRNSFVENAQPMILRALRPNHNERLYSYMIRVFSFFECYISAWILVLLPSAILRLGRRNPRSSSYSELPCHFGLRLLSYSQERLREPMILKRFRISNIDT